MGVRSIRIEILRASERIISHVRTTNCSICCGLFIQGVQAARQTYKAVPVNETE